MAVTTGMVGGGFYDHHSTTQRVAMQTPLAWLEEALGDLPPPFTDSGAIAFLDAGSSEGANAIYAYNRLLEQLRTHTPAPVQLYFDDLPTNDFNHLFFNLYGEGNLAFSSEEVYAAAIGGSAYRRLLPPRTLHLATTFNALGFLATRPAAPLPGYVFPEAPGPAAPRSGVHVLPEELTPFRQQAAEDLRQYYQARAEELLPGGKLLVQIFGRNQDFSTSQGIYDVLSDAILDLQHEGLLPADFYTRFVAPVTCRQVEDLVDPIASDPELAALYRVEQSASEEITVPFNAAREKTGDTAAWANHYMTFMRAFTEGMIKLQLPNGVDPDSLCDKLYGRIEARLVTEPERYPFHYISIGALLTRR